MKIDEEGRIVEFAEKPKGEQLKAMMVHWRCDSLANFRYIVVNHHLCYKISLVKFIPCCCVNWFCRLIQPYLVLMTWGQRKCLISLAWVSTLLANM
jgi:hypothetical protein